MVARIGERRTLQLDSLIVHELFHVEEVEPGRYEPQPGESSAIGFYGLSNAVEWMACTPFTYLTYADVMAYLEGR